MNCTRFCPAKVNLFLEVTGKRPNGYHELATIFAKINIGDTLSICDKPAAYTQVTLRLSGPVGSLLPADHNNLVCRAARGFLEHFHLTSRIEISLEKHTPIGAGLGGGSSDAANTLLALCDLFQKDKTELLPLAAQLGADVPLFMYEQPFLKGTGIGEILTPLEAGQPLPWLVLVYPNTFISTRDIFGHFELPAPAEVADNLTRLDHLITCLQQAKPLAQWAPFLFNRLEKPVTALSRPVQEALSDLKKAGAEVALMSGSGSTVFALMQDEPSARRLATQVNREDRTVFCTSFYPSEP